MKEQRCEDCRHFATPSHLMWGVCAMCKDTAPQSYYIGMNEPHPMPSTQCFNGKYERK